MELIAPSVQLRDRIPNCPLGSEQPYDSNKGLDKLNTKRRTTQQGLNPRPHIDMIGPQARCYKQCLLLAAKNQIMITTHANIN